MVTPFTHIYSFNDLLFYHLLNSLIIYSEIRSTNQISRATNNNHHFLEAHILLVAYTVYKIKVHFGYRRLKYPGMASKVPINSLFNQSVAFLGVIYDCTHNEKSVPTVTTNTLEGFSAQQNETHKTQQN